MTTTATKRFVNLGAGRTTLPGPDGHPVIVHPFQESLNPRTRRTEAIYVLEGEFWGRYATGVHSQLSRFPRPSQYGLTSFEPMLALRDDGERVDVDCADVEPASDGQHVQAGAGTPRVAADVVTPEGKIRKTLPNGEVVLLDDTPENRNQVHSDAGVVNERNPEIRDGIMQWLDDMHIESYAQFAELSDEVMLKIPGVNASNLLAIRENVGEVLRRAEELEVPDETPVGESAASTGATRTTDDPLGGALGDEDDEGDEEPEETPAPKASKKKAKKKAKKSSSKAPLKSAAKKKTTKKKTSKKKATKKKAAKKKTTRRKASD